MDNFNVVNWHVSAYIVGPEGRIRVLSQSKRAIHRILFFMGFIDAFKRWRLAEKGMSSGKKRRTTTASENAMVDSMEHSAWMKLLIYPIFAVLVCLITVFYISDQTLFHDNGIRRIFVCLILAGAVILFYHIRHSLKGGNSQVVLVYGGVLVHLVLLRAACYVVDNNPSWDVDYRILLPPLAFAPMVHSVLAGRHAGFFSALSVSLFGCLLMPVQDIFSFMVTSLVVGCVAVALTRRVRRRGSLLRAGFYVGVTTFLLALVFDKIDLALLTSSKEGVSVEGSKMAVVLMGGMLTGMVVSGLLPALESLFAITTNISWLEMSDLNHKLLRKLQLEAPGTYHHSMVVATLAESAAEEIGANAAMCRVCSYFHDIGKLNKPEYFIENQGDRNPHDTLTPTMSAIIIIAHVKDGVDMAIKHKLNPMIIEVIREHHGDSVVRFFYHKAREQRLEAEKKVDEGLENRDDLPDVDAKNFRYPGPCPSSPESGIISLADCVESASRSLKKPTPQKIRNMVNDVVMSKVTSGQFDECALTMGEIKKACNSFSSTLRSMMHTRIDYPKDEESSLGRKSQKTPEPAATSSQVVETEEAAEKKS
ncbi:MAG: HDIG domain-containing protein [Verrucomicrobiae bacterium]|nr:HDIG domain-containing protein [Verrucomicrobiae bacterium]NNJ42964.1 HDIG domain-containing protein [Akkermansiaceae bacterium]